MSWTYCYYLCKEAINLNRLSVLTFLWGLKQRDKKQNCLTHSIDMYNYKHCSIVKNGMIHFIFLFTGSDMIRFLCVNCFQIDRLKQKKRQLILFSSSKYIRLQAIKYQHYLSRNIFRQFEWVAISHDLCFYIKFKTEMYTLNLKTTI